jgi:hypothetical protein
MTDPGARIRLLRRLPDGEIQLAGPFTDDEVPAYAILSHRWESDETQEFVFEDMKQGRGRDKTGFRKIAFCVEQAWKDQLEYCWADTCCIDKSLNGEHQLAMESMFRWYQRAAKCYVYLADVLADVPLNRPTFLDRGERAWKNALEKSRLFKKDRSRGERAWETALKSS